jgi:hypothetical protein
MTIHHDCQKRAANGMLKGFMAANRFDLFVILAKFPR